jgi:glucuronoarabinoxylan endo-1,4-beta-xylanase
MRWTWAVFLWMASATLFAQTATVNLSTVNQQIDGFGGASAFGGLIPGSVINEEFSPGGLGFKFIRLQLVPDYEECAAYAPFASTGGCVSVSSGATLTTYDLQNAQAAVAQGAVVWATLWSPPGSMKSNGAWASGGEMLGNATNYTALAAIEASFVTLMTGTYGIPIYAISIQNEPNVMTSYPSCGWAQSVMWVDFVPYLSRALAAAGYPNTKIMMAEPGHWNYNYMAYAMNTPSVAPLIGIIAAHAYTGGSPANTPAYLPTEFAYTNFTTQHIWQTEVSDTNETYDGSMVSGLTYALDIHQWLTISKVNAWHYWELSGQNYSDNEGLTSWRYNVLAKRAYVMGNWAKFVTGMSEVAATANPQKGVYVTAFVNLSTGAAAVVAINTNATPASQVFTISGRPGAASYTTTAYITDPNNSLAEQAPLSVSSNSFTATLTGSSVTSFVMPPSS